MRSLSRERGRRFSLKSRIELIESGAKAALEKAGSLELLEQWRIAWLSRGAELSLLLREVGSLDPDERKQVGATANKLRASLTALYEANLQELTASAQELEVEAEQVDVTMPGRLMKRGFPNPLTEVIRSLEDVFIGLGYCVAEGPEVETEYNNFEALNIPEGHPTRTDMDSFFVRDDLLLRTHTSPVQVRVMKSQEPPIYVVVPGRCYRRDEPDATHMPVFHQIEGLAVEEGLSMADLKGTLEAFARGAFGEATKIRLVSSFFPFTEPSVQLEVSCPLCAQKGCSQCAAGWLEIGGAGMVDPAVFEAVGIDPERFTGFAFGMGIERIAMIRYQVNDLRLFYEGTEAFGKSFRSAQVVR